MASQKESPRIKIKKAVALRYRPQQEDAPKVTAKGMGRAADKILELAEEYGVPIEQDPDLVEVLAQVELDEEIPQQVYLAVAEILSFIYRTNDRWRDRFKGLGGPVVPS